MAIAIIRYLAGLVNFFLCPSIYDLPTFPGLIIKVQKVKNKPLWILKALSKKSLKISENFNLLLAISLCPQFGQNFPEYLF